MARFNRQKQRAQSNNPCNGNKNICALEVAKHLDVDGNVRYLHFIGDLVRAARQDWTVRSRLSGVNGKSVGGARGALQKIAKQTEKSENSKLPKNLRARVQGFIIRVDGHVIFVDPAGRTVVDTDPRKRDQRKITHCYIVYGYFKGNSMTERW